MEQLIYNLFSRIAERHELLWLVQDYRDHLDEALLIIAVLFCLFGFYCYRGSVSILVFLIVTAIGGIWIRPIWGQRSAATFCAVLGVVCAFLAYRWLRFGAVLLSSLIGGSLTWLLLDGKLSLHMLVIAAVIVGIVFGLLAFFFPFWSLCVFTALWGGACIASVYGGLIGFLLWIPGSALQLFLFRRQKLFTKIMPKKLEHYLWQRKEGAK